MRDYAAGFVFGATLVGSVLLAVPTTVAGTYGNFSPSVSFDGASRVIDIREHPIYG